MVFEHRNSNWTVHASRVYRNRVVECPKVTARVGGLLYSRLAHWPKDLTHQRKKWPSVIGCVLPIEQNHICYAVVVEA